MPKKKADKKAAGVKAAKKAKAKAKVERKEVKNTQKSKSKSSKDEFADEDNDLEGILDRMKREWEEAHKVTEETADGPPSRRANATLTACPNGNHIWCIGGEFFSDDGKAYFYNDVYRYSPEKDEWRNFISPTCPGPRSAHAVVASPAAGGQLFLFGGEFSSMYQNTFHHYRDFWSFSVASHMWERIETKTKPSARSGHRMAMWKHFIVLFGGFYDPGIRTNYLQDLWVFDTQEYKWHQVESRNLTERWPSPRSGFSFLPTAEGIILYGLILRKNTVNHIYKETGGYYKEYVKGKRAKGVALDDIWFLKMDTNLKLLKWEKRKKIGYAPSLRSGCTMTYWPAKATGILFGGVYDDDRDEETLESVFYNDLYGYQTPGNGRWIYLTLKKPKKKPGGGGQKKKGNQTTAVRPHDDDEEYDDDGELIPRSPVVAKERVPSPETDPDDPILTTPLVRYNAMLAVLRNTLYIYGGIFERGAREYTLDDFYALPLDKLDRYVCLKASGITVKEGELDESSEGSSDDTGESGSESGSGSDSNEVADPSIPAHPESESEPEEKDNVGGAESQTEEVVEEDALRTQATAFLGVSRDATRSPEDIISTPNPGETIAMFYARSRDYWATKAQFGDVRGKDLRRAAFELSEKRYAEYEPILKEVEKILAEAGLDEEEMRRSAAAGAAGPSTTSRNRR